MSKVQARYKSTELGDIPEDWEIVSLADIADPNKPYALTGGPFGSDLRSEEYTTSGVRIIQLQNIKEGYFSNGYKIYTSEEKANQLFSCNIFPNDIIIAKMAEPVARACIIPNLHERYLMASDGIRLAVNEEEYSTKYVMYAINSSYFRQQAIDNSTGTTRSRIGLKTLKGLKLLRPSKEEQQKIVSILSSVDEAIEKTETIIEQTEEVKKGLMQQLLTKGIGHTHFKRTESGEIPESWEVALLKDCVETLVTGRTYTPEYVENGVPILRSPDLKQGFPDFTQCLYVTAEEHVSFKKAIPKKGDIIYIREGGSLGIPAYNNSDREFALGQRLSLIRSNEQLLISKFLYYQLSSKRIANSVKGIIGGNASPHINQKDIERFMILLPPLEEQNIIVQSLASLEDKERNENLKLAKLREIKKGLMQSLLTGKVRVKVDEAEVTQV